MLANVILPGSMATLCHVDARDRCESTITLRGKRNSYDIRSSTSHNLLKTYEGNVETIKDIAVSIRQGELYPLLGPNETRKTIFLRIISCASQLVIRNLITFPQNQ